MRYALMTLFLLTAGLASADDSIKVRVALALCEAGKGCGKCRTDIDNCRDEAKQSGNALVIFVGGCQGRAQGLPVDTIACRVHEYTNDKRPANEPRIVIVKDGRIRDTLPPNATLVEIRGAIRGSVKWRS